MKASLPATISLPEAVDFGPAMQALNERQRAFVVAAFALGCEDPVDAARAAGYPDSGKSGIRVQAYRLMHHPKVQAAIDEWAKRADKGLVPFIRHNLIKIAGNAKHRDQAKVNMYLYGVAGHSPITESKITHEIVLTEREKIEKIREFAHVIGRDPKELLGQVVDVEFEDVTEDPWADVEY